MRYGAKIKKSEVMIDQIEVSMGLTQFLATIAFLHTFTLKLTPTKKAPMQPPTTPIINAPMRFWAELILLAPLNFPNLMVEPAKPSPMSSSDRLYRIPRRMTAREQVMKVFQIIWKDQKEVGFDIS